jgi:hypothetical protein
MLWQCTVYAVLTHRSMAAGSKVAHNAASLQGTINSPAPLTLSDA